MRRIWLATCEPRPASAADIQAARDRLGQLAASSRVFIWFGSGRAHVVLSASSLEQAAAIVKEALLDVAQAIEVRQLGWEDDGFGHSGARTDSGPDAPSYSQSMTMARPLPE